jgi:hypothetical protein
MRLFYNYLLNRKIRLKLNSEKRRREFRNFSKVSTVLLLFDIEDYSDIAGFIKLLKSAGKKVSVVAFGTKKDTVKYPVEIKFIVTGKDINFTRSETIKAVEMMLKNKVFDLALDMTGRDSLLVKYVTVSANALLKVGISGGDGHIHDMLVLPPADGEKMPVRELGKHMIYYLNMIS